MRNFLVVLGVFLLIGGNLQPAVAGLSDGLVLYYDFEDNPPGVVTDKSGHLLNGVVYGNALRSTDAVAGKGAYKFDGDGDYIQAPASALLDTPQFTASAWVQSNELNMTTEARAPLGKHQAGNNVHSYWMFQWKYSANAASLFNAQVWGESAEATNQVYTEDVRDLIGKWVMVTLTYDGTLMKLYTNGQFVGLHPAVGNQGNPLQLLIGAGEYQYGTGLPDRFWKGLIDDVRIYDRELSHEDVQELFRKCGKVGCPN